MEKTPDQDEDDTGPICRRSTRKRGFPLTTPSKSSHRVSRPKSAQSMKNKNERIKKDISQQAVASISDELGDFSVLNESDLALAALDDEEFLLADGEPLSSRLLLENKKNNEPESKSGVNCTPSKKGFKSDWIHTNRNQNDCSPEQDLFDDDDDLFESSDHAGKENLRKVYYKEVSLDDSLSNIFFRNTEEEKKNTENSTPSTKSDLEKEKPMLLRGLEDANSKTIVSPVNATSSKSLPDINSMSTPNTSITSSNLGSAVLHRSSLKDRLKQRLKMNVGVVSCQKKIEDKMREEAIVQAKLDASQIRKAGTDVDIGPFHGLPMEVQNLLQTTRGISKLYDWQVECLQLQALKERRNLIYSLPTSGGKTLVAEILIMRELLCYKRDALLVLPFVSIVQEKVRSITEFATQLGFIVEEYAGSKGRFPPIKRREKKSLYIATIEKAHSLVNSLIENDRITALGLMVVDELHMIGEGGSRGANLEAMLLKAVASKSDTQIIGMSATLNNIKDLQDFLHAEIYSNDFRPVSLKEFVKVDDNIFALNHKALQEDEKLEHEKIVTFPYTTEALKQDPDHLLGLVMEVVPTNSCLVFCSSKKNCENVALMLSKLMAKQHRHLTNVNREKRKDLLRELSQDGDGNICPVLEYTIHFGIAYHHSGLTMDERRLIEDAYSDGTLCLLACTSTLAAGVNLPAKRVILRSPYVGMNLIKFSQYKQMVGRAGRAGIDSSGESFLIVKRQDRMKVKEMLAGPKDVCHSSLAYEEGKGVKSLLLSAIGLKMVTSTEAALQLMSQSLLHIQSGHQNVDVTALTRESVQYLLDQGLVTQARAVSGGEELTSTCNLQVSSIGKATFKGSVDHAYSSQLYKDLKAAEMSLNLATPLHLLYLVTPYDTALTVTPSWDIYFKKFCKLTEVEAKVAGVIGVPENYLALRAAGHSSRRKICVLTVNRFYLSLMLWELWNQRTVWEVAETFTQTRGFVQNLLSQAAAFASCVLHFCQELEEFWAYQDLLGSFLKRLSHCVSSELLPLMEIPGVKLARAKQLYTAGYGTVAKLAGVDEATLVREIEHMSRRAARQIIAAAKNILEEKTAALMEEVDMLMTVEVTKSL